MTNPDFASHEFRPNWGQTIAEFGNSEAFEALRPLATDPDIEIRTNALKGMELLAFAAKKREIKENARKHLELALQNEVEAELRTTIQRSLDILPQS